MLRFLILLLLLPSPAFAIIEGKVVSSSSALGRSVVYFFSMGGEVCSATLIRQNVLLTAAHCVQKGRKTFANFPYAATKIRAASAVIHPSYKPFKRGSKDFTTDLALIKLAKDAPAPYAPIAITGGASQGSYLTLVGWGKTDYRTKAKLDALREVNVPVATVIKEHHLITRRSDRSSAGGCGGDSGGPAIRWGGIAGIMIMSAAEDRPGCGSLTMILKLDAHLQWIEQAILKL